MALGAAATCGSFLLLLLVLGKPQTSRGQDNPSDVKAYAQTIVAAFNAIKEKEFESADRLLAGTDSRLRSWEFDYLQTTIRTAADGGTAGRVPGLRRPPTEGEVNIASADPVRRTVALPCLDGNLRVLDLGDGPAAGKPKVTSAFSTGTQLIIGGYSADGSTYVVGGEDGRVFIWKPDEAAEPTSFSAGGKPVVGIAVNRNGTRLVTATDRGEVSLWD